MEKKGTEKKTENTGSGAKKRKGKKSDCCFGSDQSDFSVCI